ncbi:MAG: permease-like cell division protein FtsX [Legionellaceae bacterium]|nr:permease-like cell division protein FtsX [Legionellaceae bacterium]
MRGRQWVKRHLQAIKNSAKTLRSTPWATAVTVIVLAVTLILPVLFWLLMGHLKPLTNEWREGNEIALYLDSPLSSANETALLVRVRETEGVGHATFVSAEASLKELEQQEGMQDIRRYLPNNPLPSVINVMPASTLDTPEKLDSLFEKLKHYPHVEQAKLNRDWSTRLYALLGFMTYLTWILGGLFGLMVVFIIRNLLRLAAQEHHEEIEVLKLIGATDSFIIRPFLYTGMCLGAAGALLAFLGVHAVLYGLSYALHGLISAGFGVPLVVKLSLIDAIKFAGFGLILGWLGAYLPLKRQLARIEPCH